MDRVSRLNTRLQEERHRASDLESQLARLSEENNLLRETMRAEENHIIGPQDERIARLEAALFKARAPNCVDYFVGAAGYCQCALCEEWRAAVLGRES